ncbi:MAG: hypothetical protein JRC77_02760, partial [Deltaproteobacteria bacterium]|nr:hypothetical protein [Deltaproteobacteria bacterium]
MSHRLSLGHLRAFFSAAIFMLLLPGCSTIPEETGVDHEQRIDNVPMYGQPEIPRPEFLKEADANFIRDAARKYDGDREVASDAWAKKADRYIAQGELHY